MPDTVILSDYFLIQPHTVQLCFDRGVFVTLNATSERGSVGCHAMTNSGKKVVKCQRDETKSVEIALASR